MFLFIFIGVVVFSYCVVNIFNTLVDMYNEKN